jgi:hypothetical protein
MNIYALNGHKVKCKTLFAGYNHHKETAKKHLTIGYQYTVEKTEVDRSHTDVVLKEFPDVRFNSVFFEDATKQSLESDKKHPDYYRFN